MIGYHVCLEFIVLAVSVAQLLQLPMMVNATVALLLKLPMVRRAKMGTNRFPPAPHCTPSDTTHATGDRSGNWIP